MEVELDEAVYMEYMEKHPYTVAIRLLEGRIMWYRRTKNLEDGYESNVTHIYEVDASKWMAIHIGIE